MRTNEKCNLKVSEVRVILVKHNEGLIGFASLVLFNSIYISSIGIYRKLSGGYRITYPTKIINNKNFEIFHPINSELSKYIEESIFTKVKEILGE